MRLCRLILLVAAIAPVARAQVGSTTDIITGRVIGPDSVPLVGAKVDVVSAETQVTRSTRTNDRGRYTVVFPDGGGQYGVTVTYVGFAPARIMVQRNADEDRLIANAQMSQNPTQLSEVTVRGRRQPAGQRTEAGGTERGLPPAITNRLPIDAGDLAALATLVPGVIPVAGTDSTPLSFVVAGQPPNQNAITLDGLTFGAGAIPSDAVRSTRVITNTYDVARGQFTGGQVASTTRGGTNNLAGTISYVLRDPTLEFSSVNGPFSNEFSQNQLSFGIGGPLVKDRAFLFASAQVGRRSSGLPSLLTADRTSLSQLGTSTDSVARFLALLGAKGLPVGLAGDRVTDNGSAIVRGDVTLNESHSLTLRLDWRGTTQNNARLSALSVPESGGDANSSGGGAMLTATSRLSQFINEARAYTSIDNRVSDPYQSLPAGRVVVASTIDGGFNAVSTLQFGGNSALPQRTRTTMTEASDELSWVSPEAAHRLKLGGLLTIDQTKQGSFANQFGTFTFNSLADFANNQPSAFTRTLSSHTRASDAVSAAVYLGDGWRVTDELQVTLGARAEGTRYPTRPEYNPAVEAAFARRTDDVPSEVHVSPRAGFTWQLGRSDNAPPIVVVRGGIGEFRSRAPSQLVATALDATGLGTGQSQIVCIGADVPVPDWNRYRDDPSSIPQDCGTTTTIGSRRNVSVFAPGFQAPRAWRGSLGLTRRIHDLFSLSVDGTYARGVAQTGATDLNLRDSSRFVLRNEGGRPVYVPVDAVIGATGQTSLLASRRVTGFGDVNELDSRLQSDTRQLTVSLGGFGLRGAMFNTGYTWGRSRDEGFGFAQGFFGGGSTSGDPNRSEWGRSDRDIRHQLFAQVLYPLTTSLDATFIARATSGTPYSPLVAGDINGDGSRNDRAFVYDPATAPDTALANGMRRLLASASGSARTCLESQLGRIAGRNSCESPWTGALDMQLNWRPTSFGLNRRLTVSLQMINVLTGVDQLVHGSGDMRGWGQQSFTDRTLLYVRGFDRTPGAERFLYQVNEHFGSGSSRAGVSAPFQLGLTGRYQIGIDDSRRAMFNVLGGQNGQPLGADQLKERMRRGITNPFYRIIAVNDSLQLGLTAEQEARLKSLGDTLQSKIDPAIDEIAEAIAKQGKNADPQALRVTLGRRLGEARTLVQQASKDAQQTLTAEQWGKLPPDVKTPGTRRPGQGGDRPRGDREP